MPRRSWMLLACVGACGIADVASAQPASVLRGRVLADSTEVPIGGASIRLTAHERGATSDSAGNFAVGGIKAGRYQVFVRRLGFAPVIVDLTFTGADTIEADFVLTAVPQAIAGVEVTTTLLERKLVDFEDRRRLGIGSFLNGEELEKAPGTRLSEKLRHMPGLLVNYGRRNVTISSTRGGADGRPCPAQIRLDGIVVDAGSVNDFSVTDVAAVEWYSGPSQVPMRYGGTRRECALLMIWTK